MRIHRYSGKENGLMIMGSIEELQSLGQALMNAGSAKSAYVPPEKWPVHVASFIPAGKDKYFNVSFHVDTAENGKPETNFP